MHDHYCNSCKDKQNTDERFEVEVFVQEYYAQYDSSNRLQCSKN